jgi:hypothetical protein
MPDKTQKLNKLKELMKLLDESLTKADFTAAFSAVMKQILTLEQNLIKKIDIKTQSATDTLAELKKEYKDTIAKIKEENQSSFSNMKRWAISQVNELFIKYQLKEKLAVLDERMANIKDGDVLAKIPAPIPETADQILEKITGLIEIGDIKGLKEALEEVKSRRVYGGGGGFSKIAMDFHIIDGEVVAGSGTTFTLAHTPSPATSLKLYGRGQRLRLTTDFTLSGLVITTIDSWSAGDIISDYLI